MSIHTLLDSVRAHRAILGFLGKPDAGETISRVFSELESALPSELAAVWDLDAYWCTDATRPEVFAQHGQIRHIEWPEFRFSLCSPPSSQPFLLGIGPEPSMHWRSFIRKLLARLDQWGCREILLLGSFRDQIFHDETIFSAVVHDPAGFNRMRELGCEELHYEGPAAVHSVIMEAATNEGFRCAAIWSHYPFYLNSQHELLAARLLDIVGALFGIQFDTTRLLVSWHKKEREIEDLIHSDQELRRLLDGMKREEPLTTTDPAPHNVLRLDEFLKKRKE